MHPVSGPALSHLSGLDVYSVTGFFQRLRHCATMSSFSLPSLVAWTFTFFLLTFSWTLPRPFHFFYPAFFFNYGWWDDLSFKAGRGKWAHVRNTITNFSGDDDEDNDIDDDGDRSTLASRWLARLSRSKKKKEENLTFFYLSSLHLNIQIRNRGEVNPAWHSYYFYVSSTQLSLA